MSRHARTTSLHRPTTSGLQLARACATREQRRSSSTHRTHEVHARRQDGRGRVFARDATRPASLDGPVERSPSRSATPRSTRLRAAVPETAQRFLLLFFSSPSVLRCSSGECGLTTNIALPNSQTRARVSRPPSRDRRRNEMNTRRHPPSRSGDYAVEPTLPRWLSPHVSYAEKSVTHLSEETKPRAPPHLGTPEVSTPKATLRCAPERRSASLWGYARRGGLRPLPSTSAERRETRPGGPVRGEGEMEVVSRDRSSQPARRAPDVWPCPPPPGSRAAVMHTLPSLHPRSYTTSPGPDASGSASSPPSSRASAHDRVRDTSNESRCQTAKPERGCPPPPSPRV